MRYKLFREARNNRKSSRPKKCQGKKNNLIFKAKNRNSSNKVQRGNLNMARANAIQNMRAEGNNFRKIQESFNYKAQKLLKDMVRMRHYIEMSH